MDGDAPKAVAVPLSSPRGWCTQDALSWFLSSVPTSFRSSSGQPPIQSLPKVYLWLQLLVL